MLKEINDKIGGNSNRLYIDDVTRKVYSQLTDEGAPSPINAGSDAPDLTNEVNQLSGSVNQLSGTVQDISIDVVAVTNNVSTISGSVFDCNTRVDMVVQQLNSMSGDITTVQQDLVNTQAQITGIVPSTASSGDIVYITDVGVGNEVDTVFLLQGGSFNNTASGSNNIPITNLGDDSSIVNWNSVEQYYVFDGHSVLSINPISQLGLPYLIDTSTGFTIDIIWYSGRMTSESMTLLQAYTTDGSTIPNFKIMVNSGANKVSCFDVDSTDSWTYGVTHYMSVEVGSFSTDRAPVYIYHDGLLKVQSNVFTQMSLGNTDSIYIGGSMYPSDTDNFNGRIKAVRIKRGTTHNGTSFTPDPLPWLKPEKKFASMSLAELKAALSLLP